MCDFCVTHNQLFMILTVQYNLGFVCLLMDEKKTLQNHVAIYAVLTRADLNQLLDRAVLFCQRTAYARCSWLYRNKSKEYFIDIDNFHFGIMEPYLKDHSGDPASPINGHLPGLFFMSTPDADGHPPRTSPFGPRRLQVEYIYFMSYYRNLLEFCYTHAATNMYSQLFFTF